MTLETARLMAGVNRRAMRLFLDGYRALIREDLLVEVTNSRSDTYLVNPFERTCSCAFSCERDLPCKHYLGYEKLLKDQEEAGVPGHPFGPCMRFPLGNLVVTPGASILLERLRLPSLPLFRRHSMGDWGEVDGHDKRANERDLKTGGRLLSAYRLSDGTPVWVITEADRSATTLLFPEEY